MYRDVRRGVAHRPMKVFHLSNSYLCAVFVALAVDAAIGWPALGW
jgi:protoheme IX farnesyltransferase